MNCLKPTRRHFTNAARAAAIAVRRRKREEAVPLNTPVVFVVRMQDMHREFAWEVRRFGGVVLERGKVGYATRKAARSAGEHALSGMLMPV